MIVLFLACTTQPRLPSSTTPSHETGQDITDTASTDVSADSGLADADADGTQPETRDPIPADDILERSISAVFRRYDGKAFFFSEADYVRYDLSRNEADSDYPRATARWWSGLGESDLDAAFEDANANVWFFRGDSVWRYDWTADAATPDSPFLTTTVFPGVWPTVDAAARHDGVVYFFRGDEVLRWDADQKRVIDGDPKAIYEMWPGLAANQVNAAFVTADRLYLFHDQAYSRVDLGTGLASEGYPRSRLFWWPGLWDPMEGSGDPDHWVDASLLAQLRARPTEDEIAARRARVSAAAAADGYDDLSSRYPRYLESLEDRLGVWGCGILKRPGQAIYRFRCATHTAGPIPLDIAPMDIDWIDWRAGAHHSQQVSQGDFSAEPGTPLSVFRTDDGTFRVIAIGANRATGSINAGLNVRVAFMQEGVERQISFSHLNDHIPADILAAYASGTPLPVGRVFGFIGATGNLWMAAPPAEDRPYTGDGAGLPVPHSHLWFVNDPSNHETLTPRVRSAIDFSGRYPYGGG